jgi:hypothetical protein
VFVEAIARLDLARCHRTGSVHSPSAAICSVQARSCWGERSSRIWSTPIGASSARARVIAAISCASFTGLAIAAGIPVRAWAFSFDGFGGHGHVWVEIWNRQLERWQLLDVFNNYYFVGIEASPVGARVFAPRCSKIPPPSSCALASGCATGRAERREDVGLLPPRSPGVVDGVGQ